MARYLLMVRVTLITWLTLLPRMMRMDENGLDGFGDGVEPLVDEVRNGNLILPASAVEALSSLSLVAAKMANTSCFACLPH